LMFTDYYAENSCTAGRSSFITGQAVTAQGCPSRNSGRAVAFSRRHYIAEALSRSLCLRQFARTISAIATKYLPTVHGFDDSSATSTTSTRGGAPSGELSQGERSL